MFESVVPSERTQIFVKVVDSSIQLLAPSYPGAVVSHIQELEFSTVLSGSLPVLSLSLNVPSFSLWLIDDVGTMAQLSSTADDVRSASASSGSSIWKVCYLA